MPETIQTTQTCYGCVHQRYRGPAIFKERMRFTGGNVVPLRDGDVAGNPGVYGCARFEKTICFANETLKLAESGFEKPLRVVAYEGWIHVGKCQ